MRSPAHILFHYFFNNAFDEVRGFELFTSFFPDAPDDGMTFFDTAGTQDGRLMETGEKITHPGIQIQIRCGDYTRIWQLANFVATTLDAVKKVSVVIDGGEVYVLHNVSRKGDINPVGIETVGERRRYLFTINMTVTLAQENVE